VKPKQILIADAAFLGLAGTVQMVLEIAGHFAGIGRYAGQFYQSPYTIGFFEAHGLAAVIAFMLFVDRSRANDFWHRFLLLVHLLLGGANVFFWQSFVAFDFVLAGMLATLLHFIFIGLNGYQLTRR
jgi:hypothetical protein